MKKKSSLLFLTLICVYMLSCSDESDPALGSMTLEFDNIVGSANLELNTANTPYTNSKGEAYKLTWLTYYVSNIKLKRTDGTFYADEVKSNGSAGYYLVDEADSESQEVLLKNIPEGEYTEVTFTIGVDASQVDRSAQTGPLDPAKGLFWNWSSGYIFMAIEGASPASTEAGNVFQYHVGGYKEDAGNVTLVNNIKTLSLSFNGQTAPVRAEHEPKVHLVFDVNKLFSGPATDVSFTSLANRHLPKECQDIAGNIVGAFVVDHIHAN